MERGITKITTQHSICLSTGSSSGGAQMASETSAQTSQDMLKELAWAIAQHMSAAMRDFAATGDVRYLLSVQQQLTAVQNDDGDT